MSKILAPLIENIKAAADALRAGDIFGMPTETVYGLGSDATNPVAIAKVFAAKNRPEFNPLISHVSGIEMAHVYGVFDKIAMRLADAFWPGALTIVVPRTKDCQVCDLACAGLETIALRAPMHKVAQEIIAAFGGPIAAPSANISGNISPTSASHVLGELGEKVEFIIDGGNCEIGLESTVVAVLDGQITLLRHGVISIADLERASDAKVLIADLHDETAPKSPGMMLRHYAPKAKIILNATHAEEGEIFIAFGDAHYPPTPAEEGDQTKFGGGGKIANNRFSIIQLSQSANLTEAAANLYSAMREADSKNPKAIRVAPIPNTGIGAAINDRLNRAAGNF